MRRVPGLRRLVVAQPDAIGMADHGRTGCRAGPVAAGAVLAGGEGGSIGLRAGQHIVAVRRIAAAVDDLAFLAQRSLLGEIVRPAVQLGDVLGDDDALGVPPRAFADAVARVHRRLAVGGLRRQISAPDLGTCASRLGQGLAMPVGTSKAAEIAALAGAVAGEEEAHVRAVSRRSRDQAGCDGEQRAADQDAADRCHGVLPGGRDAGASLGRDVVRVFRNP